MMIMFKKIINVINNNKLKIILDYNYIDIINYTKIIDINSNLININKDNKYIHIKGDNLSVKKMIDNEVLITGTIKSVELR